VHFLWYAPPLAYQFQQLLPIKEGLRQLLTERVEEEVAAVTFPPLLQVQDVTQEVAAEAEGAVQEMQAPQEMPDLLETPVAPQRLLQ
jgi:hypothetical protein